MQTSPVLSQQRVTFRLDEVVIDCADPEVLARFWGQVLSFDLTDCGPEVCAIEDPAGVRPSICFQRVPDQKRSKNRVHFDLDVGEDMLDTAVEQLVALGARPVNLGQPDHCSWAVMADPEGNEFCVIA